jgi:hypothetical protein
VSSTFHLIPVAFLRSTGGMVNVLLAVDEGDEQLFEGEPALLVAHRPGSPPHELRVETAAALAQESLDAVQRVADVLAQLIEGAYTRQGEFDPDLLLGKRVPLDAPSGTFTLVELD